MKTEKQIAKLTSVAYDRDTDEVYVTFKVFDEEYKALAMQFSTRDDIEIVFRGDQLWVVEEK